MQMIKREVTALLAVAAAAYGIAASGAHVWASKPCVVFANERFVAVHTKDGGEIKVSLPRRYARITDLLADKVVAENADSFTCTFSSPDTRLFDLSEND